MRPESLSPGGGTARDLSKPARCLAIAAQNMTDVVGLPVVIKALSRALENDEYRGDKGQALLSTVAIEGIPLRQALQEALPSARERARFEQIVEVEASDNVQKWVKGLMNQLSGQPTTPASPLVAPSVKPERPKVNAEAAFRGQLLGYLRVSPELDLTRAASGAEFGSVLAQGVSFLEAPLMPNAKRQDSLRDLLKTEGVGKREKLAKDLIAETRKAYPGASDSEQLGLAQMVSTIRQPEPTLSNALQEKMALVLAKVVMTQVHHKDKDNGQRALAKMVAHPLFLQLFADSSALLAPDTALHKALLKLDATGRHQFTQTLLAACKSGGNQAAASPESLQNLARFVSQVRRMTGPAVFPIDDSERPEMVLPERHAYAPKPSPQKPALGVLGTLKKWMGIK